MIRDRSPDSCWFNCLSMALLGGANHPGHLPCASSQEVRRRPVTSDWLTQLPRKYPGVACALQKKCMWIGLMALLPSSSPDFVWKALGVSFRKAQSTSVAICGGIMSVHAAKLLAPLRSRRSLLSSRCNPIAAIYAAEDTEEEAGAICCADNCVHVASCLSPCPAKTAYSQ